MSKQRIHNPRTHSYVRIARRTSPNRHRGQIVGPWHRNK